MKLSLGRNLQAADRRRLVGGRVGIRVFSALYDTLRQEWEPCIEVPQVSFRLSRWENFGHAGEV